MKSKMNKLYLFLASVAAAGMLLCAPAARADQISNWQLALPGGPLNTGISNLSFNGASSIVNTLMPDNTFTFTDTGVFNIIQKNGGIGLLLGGGQLTLNYHDGAGTGTLGGNFTFNGNGLLDVYYSPAVTYGTAAPRYGATAGTLIGSFQQLAGGGGIVNPDGTPSANGVLTLNFVSTFLDPLVWMDSVGNALLPGFTLGFVTTNASEDQSNNCPGPECSIDPNLTAALGAGPNNAPSNFMVVNGGQLKLETQAVPEPGTLALLGLGLLGVTVLRRRHS